MNLEAHTDLKAAYGMHEVSILHHDENMMKNEHTSVHKTDNLPFQDFVNNKVNVMMNQSSVFDKTKCRTDIASASQDPLRDFTSQNSHTTDGILDNPLTIDIKEEMQENEDDKYEDVNPTMLDNEFFNSGIDSGHSIFGEDYSPDVSLLSRITNNIGQNRSTETQFKQVRVDRCQRESSLSMVEVSTCERCGYKTIDPRHIDCLIVTQSGEKPYSCQICQKAFKFKNKLVTHVRIHIGDKPFSCDVCKKAFRLKNKLKVHSRIHTNIKPYACHVCDKAFFEGRSLRYHLTTHTDDKPFPCTVCEKSFAYGSGLQRHMKIHTGDRPFSCNVCEKTFKQKCNLERHMRVHSGEKPYPCHICKKNFVESGHLQIHLRIHSGEKPFICDVCNKRFTIKNGLQRHMRIHTGDRPYACKVCSRTFNEKSNFLKHERICIKKPYHRKVINVMPEIIYLTQPKKKS